MAAPGSFFIILACNKWIMLFLYCRDSLEERFRKIYSTTVNGTTIVLLIRQQETSANNAGSENV
jgi:hypothetical protein